MPVHVAVSVFVFLGPYAAVPVCTQVKALRELPVAASAAMDALLGKGGSSHAAKAAAASAALPAGITLDGPGINSMAWMEQQVGGWRV
eukprot:1137235-Pelagomonas_calceolata.AAC.2